jgi:DNA polymerase
MFVGEEPGDVEDKLGHTFVGPAGKLLDRAFDAVGIDRDDVYLTNAVKHFKWAKDARTKRRIHKTPSASEIRACFPWLEHEIALIKPEVIVCLGAIAAKALLGRTFSVMKSRGLKLDSVWSPALFATVHPASVLRAARGERTRAERMFVADIQKVVRYLAATSNHSKHAVDRSPKLSRWPTTAHRSDTSSGSTRSLRA